MLPLQKQCVLAEDRLQYNVSVPYPKLGLENTGNIELGAAPLVQYYSVFSSRPSLRYGTLIQFGAKHFSVHIMSGVCNDKKHLASYKFFWAPQFRYGVAVLVGLVLYCAAYSALVYTLIALVQGIQGQIQPHVLGSFLGQA